MTESPARFRALAAYWPADSAMYFWEYFDRDAIARDVDAAGTLQLTDLTLSLLWNDFQPQQDRVAVETMRRLEQVLDVAADRGTRFLLILFPVEVGSLLWLPPWALSSDSSAGRPVVSGHHLSRWESLNLFSDPRMVAAETRLVRELVGAFGDHPAAAGWVLGDRLGQASAPPSAAAFEEWLGTMAEAARASGQQPALWHGLAGRDVVRSRQIDPSALARLDIHALVTWQRELPWAPGVGADWPAFLAGYTTRLVGAPAVLADIGRCTTDRVFVPDSQCVDQAEAARLDEEVVTAVRNVGGGGVAAAALLDFSASLGRTLPFRENPAELTRGLFFADRRPKEAAELWSDVSRAAIVPRPVPDALSPVDSEERLRDPEGVARDCFAQFTR